jgi:hypothetical protein
LPTSPEDDFMTIAELAEALGESPGSFYGKFYRLALPAGSVRTRTDNIGPGGGVATIRFNVADMAHVLSRSGEVLPESLAVADAIWRLSRAAH